MDKLIKLLNKKTNKEYRIGILGGHYESIDIKNDIAQNIACILIRNKQNIKLSYYKKLIRDDEKTNEFYKIVNEIANIMNEYNICFYFKVIKPARYGIDLMLEVSDKENYIYEINWMNIKFKYYYLYND